MNRTPGFSPGYKKLRRSHRLAGTDPFPSDEFSSNSEDSGETSSSSDSSSESGESVAPSPLLISIQRSRLIKPQSPKVMAETDATLVASLRKRLDRLLRQATKTRESMDRCRDSEIPETIDVGVYKEILETIADQKKEHEKLSSQLFDLETNSAALDDDDSKADEWKRVTEIAKKSCSLLLSQGNIFTGITALEVDIKALTSAFELQPENDHGTAVADVVAAARALKADMKTSIIPKEEELWGRGGDMIERAAAIQGRVAGTRALDVKPAVSTSKAHIKLKYVEVPGFSGKTEDWAAFIRLFRQSVHNNPDLDDASKLTYLLQAIQDPKVKRDLSERMEEPGAYQTFIKELEATHDKPRWMHRRYVDRMMKMTTQPRSREGLMAFLAEGQSIRNGLTRLKGEDLDHVLTSLMELTMDASTRTLWNQKTSTIKTTPTVDTLFSFIKDEADQIEDAAPNKEKVRPKQVPHNNYNKKGSVNHVQGGAPQQGQQSNATPQQPQQRGHQRNYNPPVHYGDRPPSTVTCFLCNGPHTLYHCTTFGSLSVAERKGKAISMKLCLNCLKPYHIAKECASNFRCRVGGCGLKHNSLLHEERNGAPQPVNNQQANAAVHQINDEDGEECLLMTAKVSMIGANNEIITVRALLDSGSTLSICTDQLARQLRLPKTGKQVAIRGIKSKNSDKLHPMRRVTLASEYQPEWRAEIKVASMPEVIRELPLQHAQGIRDLPHLRELHLADSQFDCPGKIELLLGQNVYRHLFKGDIIKGPRMEDPEAWLTVFGWTVLGTYKPSQSATHQHKITHFVASVEADKEANSILARFQELEEPSVFKIPLTAAEVKVEEHYSNTHQYDSTSKRYTVSLPKVENPPKLGESRTQAKNRARANETSLLKKGRFGDFQKVMKEYLTLGHATEVVRQEPHSQSQVTHLRAAATGVAALHSQPLHPEVDCYYMPVHSVVKESSSTTRVRAVFDASAKTTTHISLNDILAVGPTLHPTIDTILIRFRQYPVALSGDISKMYREVLLDEADQPLHRFIWRETPTEGWREFQMNRVTFGVASSPYLAVKTLQQAAIDHGEEYPEAQWQILHSFYVDDLLGGAQTVDGAIALSQQLDFILEKASFHLRKWRSSHPAVLDHMPTADKETVPTQCLIDQHQATYPKALGVSWDSGLDKMFTNIELPVDHRSTKRGVISDVARTFDVLGWISPAILPMKCLYRELWKEQADWDTEVTAEQAASHTQWREELPLLKEINLDRCYFSKTEQPVSIQLHGYADASTAAFAAVIYIRATYPTAQPTVSLVVSKTKVAPLKTRSIPQLELCGANLLARLMNTTRQTLKIPLEAVWMYSDSTAVLGWLGGDSGRYDVFSGHRIASTILLVPYIHWRHVPSGDNPADAASRGMSAAELKDHSLWWHGPAWLATEPVELPRQPTEEKLAEDRKIGMKPLRSPVMAVAAVVPVFEQSQNSYTRLVRITCYVLRFIQGARRQAQEVSSHLTIAEGQAATKFLLTRSQLRSFPEELSAIKKKKSLPPRSKVLVMHPMMGRDKLLRVGGRLWQSDYVYHVKHPIIIAATDHLAKILFQHYHLLLGHCGPSTLLTHAANLFHVMGGRALARSVCRRCVVCKKQSAKASKQLLGPLPSARIEPQLVFLHTGMDFGGPFTVRQGYTRRPVDVKVYLAIFVCFSTKAVHLEVVSDQKTGAFLAALDRFVARRGLPLHLYSDNGPNYTGARRQLEQFYKWLNSDTTQNAIKDYVFDQHITWHNIPERAPHFGGLWEAAVKAAKFHLKRIVGQERITFEELTTITCQVESFLNSRPLGPVHSHDVEGLSPLTPSHFLIGRAARAYPQEGVQGKLTTLQRWSRCKQATQHFWDRWSQEYLQILQKATKWHRASQNYMVGDLVLLTDGNEFKCKWSLGKIVAVYPGNDGLVRVVDVQVETSILPTKYANKEELAAKIKTRTSIFRRPVAKLALLLSNDETPDDEAPDDTVNLDSPVLPPS